MNQPEQILDSNKVQRVHLSHFLANTSNPCLESYPASFVEPGAYWSGAQKDSFFRSLARHSRWKPDLIAEDIGGDKSMADVCSYIELLEQGSRRESPKSRSRDAYPTAHEVSEEWVAVENAAAEALCAKETEWQETALKQRRARERKELKKTMRMEVIRESPPEGGEDLMSGPHSLKRKRLASNKEDSEVWYDRYKARKRELRGLWKREDILSVLDSRYLKTMDKMVQILENSQADKAIKGGSKPDLDDSGRDNGLSPTSRRRLQKRLWARRKRAIESGLPVSEASMEIVRLKRGRKPKAKPVDDQDHAKEDIPETYVGVDFQGAPAKLPHPPPSFESQPSEIQGDAVNESGDKDGASDESESAAKRKPYGWGKLEARQVSGVTLRTDGMDLFHMEKFASIMSFLNHVHGLSNDADHIDEVADSSKELTTISYPLLRLLRACVIQFVTCLVSHVVLHKDVETRQKRRIHDLFLTGGAEEIRAENVRECLRHMDRETSTKPFFTELKCIVKKAIAAHTQSEEETGSEPDDRDGSDETGSADGGSSDVGTDHNVSSTGFASVRFNRLTQHAFPPPGDDSHAADPLFWNPDVLSIFGGERGSLLPDETDESGLQKDLRAEEKVEEADREAAHRYERELWEEIGVKRVDPEAPVVEVDAKQTNALPECIGVLRHSNTEAEPSQSLRFRKPGGTVKSRVYIDSDEDV
ncbi:hypothetical protein JB92DRAFT_3133407 [Gautieria morchelliformis]|nr:hypothetical protein JB92DRAFT_3133407 [Gautieria morchelliformis]